VIFLLRKYPDIKTITRDRAISYGIAIKEVLPEAKQIADKFHLFQNLTKKVKEYIRSEFPGVIIVEKKKIKRYKLENLLYHKLKEINAIEEEKELIKIILKHNPVLKKILEEIIRYKKIFKSHSVRKFRKLIKEWANGEIMVLKTYTKGIYMDFEAIENAVRYKDTNAVAEGKINKIKTEKRKMYGRCNFDLLISRLFLNDYFHSVE